MIGTISKRFSPALLVVCGIGLSSIVSAADNTGKPPEPSTSSEIRELRQLLMEQQRQINELRQALRDQNMGAATAAPPSPSFRKLGEVGSTTPMIPPVPEMPAPTPVVAPQKADAPKESAPLSLRIGDTYITPVGFMDFTAVFRDTAPGSNIGTSFGNFPYRTQATVNANLSEFRFSPQNSRIGARLDTQVKGTKVLAYWESDFLGGVGNPPVGNIAVSTNSYPLRLRLFWVDLKHGKWEVLGGQSWSLMTPGRNGISPLPGDVFYSQVVDVNYLVGIPWGRIPEARFVYHANKNVSMAFALDSPEQYIGGSGGEGTIVLPAALVTPYGSQLSNGTLTLSTPNLHPDLIAKIATDGKMKNGNAVHFEVAGLYRTFKTYLPSTGQHFTKPAGAFSANLNIELLKGLRLATNNFYSDGGGRYLFGEAPDLVVSADGHLSALHSMSTASGLEYTKKNTMVFGYYGGVYVGRYTAIDTNGSKVGYGYSGASNSQDKSIQELTFGVNQTLWKDPRWGALNFMAQYAYFSRNPWYLAAGVPNHAYMNEVWLNLRYTLPGSAPAPK